MSERSHVAAALRQAIRDDLIRGPRLLVCGKGIKAQHGSGHTAIPCIGAKQIRNLIRENILNGADFTKMFLTNNGQRLPNGSFPSYLATHEIRAAIDESHRAGLPVAAHCVGGDSLSEFIRAGGDTIEHGFFLTESDCELMAKEGTWLIGTIGYLFDRQDISNEPDALEAKAIAGAQYVAAIQGGVRFAVGTDDGAEGLAHELKCLVDHGLDPHLAILSATKHAAECLGFADRGQLTHGKLADLIAVSGDPLADIRALERITMVICGGRIVPNPSAS
jgi:imidazolonepropionase-like amidohydrolase